MDIVPLLIMGVIISLLASSEKVPQITSPNISTVFSIPIIAFSYFVGRYFIYAVIHINSGYFINEISTFYWTLATGFSIGIGYFLLRNGAKGNTTVSRALWFGCIAFGLYWALNNFFMPIMFDMSFIKFSPTIMNFVYRVVIDIIFVSFGIYVFEKSYSTKP